MTLTITTNMESLMVQHNLTDATSSLNKSIERMTTGFRINSVADDAAGYSVATRFDTKLGSTEIAQNNVALGQSLLETSSSNYDILIDHFQRIRDLTEEAANGTYDQTSIDAIKLEISQRLDEIDRVAALAEYNGIKLMDGTNGTNGIKLQIGIDSSTNSVLSLAGNLFAKATSTALLAIGSKDTDFLAKYTAGGSDYANLLTKIDTALSSITSRQTNIGASQNRLDSAMQALTIQYDNITSSLSTVRDTDVAKESSKFVSSQILQQASASLLATANQAPSIALQLI